MTEPVEITCLYARVSSEKQKDERTIESQIEALKARAKEKGYPISETYADDGYSGEMLARPGLDKLRDDAAAGRFKRVLIHSPDRLSRKYLYQEIVIDELKRKGVVVEFLNQATADTAESRLQLGIQGLFAEYEKAKFQERVRRGKLHKARNGVVLGGWAPYGYRYIPKSAGAPHYEVEPETAKNVALIFDLVVSKGLSLRGVSREMAKRNIPPPGRHRRPFWGRSTIIKIIHNETYTGTTHYNKNQAVEPKSKKCAAPRRLRTSHILRPRDQWIPIQVPAIIPPAVFQRAQEIISRNRTFSGAPKYHYLLRGLVRCGSCGSLYRGDPDKGRVVYRCGQRHQTFPAPPTCRVGTIPAAYLERKVWGAVRSALSNPDLILANIRQVQEEMTRNAAQAMSPGEVQRQQEAIKAAEDRLMEAYNAQAITLDQLKEQMGRLRARRQELDQSQKDRAQQAKALNFEDLESVCAVLEKGLKKAESSFEEQQAILRGIITQIVVEGRRLRIQGAIPGGHGGETVHSTLMTWTDVKAELNAKFELLVNL